MNPGIVSESSNHHNDFQYDLELENYLHVFCKSQLPNNSSNNTYNTAYEVAAFLASIDDDEHFCSQGNKISVNTVIKFLIKTKLVPVKKTCLYCLIDLYKDNCIDPEVNWGVLTTPGKKALLSVSGFNMLVKKVQTETLGGASYTLGTIRDLVEQRIKYEYNKTRSNKLVPYIRRATLHKYASSIMSQKVFNIFNSIGSKTKSRRAAEWSQQSTIAYTMVVAVTHFFPFVEPTVYHRKKNEICENGIELWNNVERLYSKIFKTPNPVPVTQVLPNLITSTDETTFYCTPT